MSEIFQLGLDDDPNAKGGNMLSVEYPKLGDLGLGKGTIDPVERTDINLEVYWEMLRRISNGEFNVAVTDEVPVICVDGRTDEDGKRLDAPSSAGGVFGIATARVLSDTGLVLDGSPLSSKTEKNVTEDTVKTLLNNGNRTSVHGDNHSPCGCGACAKCVEIFGHIIADINLLSNASNAIGAPISDEVKKIITENAKSKLNQGGYFTEDRSEVIKAASDAGAEEEDLVDAHNELAAVINRIPGTTIDREKIREQFGKQYDIFVVDVWAFPNVAKVFNQTGYDEESDRFVAALIIYNIATASQLSGPSMPVVIVK